jgi:hypothetical protein
MERTMATDPNWSPAEPLAFVEPGSRQIAIAASGQAVHLVWSQASTLFHAQRVDGTWRAPIRIAAGEQPSLAAAVDGTLFCAYANWFLGNREIYITIWDGVKWALPQPVSRTTGESSDPAICVGSNGGVHLVWSDSTPGYSTVYHGTRESAAWVNAPIPNGKGSRPTIAANGQEVFVAWQARLASSLSGSYDVLAASKRDGEWTLPVLVSDTPELHSILPHIAANPDGRCHMVWQEQRDDLYVVRHSDRWPNGWSEPVDVSDSTVDARLAFALPNRFGLFQFVWSECALIKHCVRPGEPQGAWWAPEVACEACDGLSELAATISPTSGELFAVFGRHTGRAEPQFYYTQRKALQRKKVLLPIVGGQGDPV